MRNERQRILSTIVQLVYFMRGAIQYDDMMALTPKERKLVAAFLDKRMEIEGKKKTPVY